MIPGGHGQSYRGCDPSFPLLYSGQTVLHSAAFADNDEMSRFIVGLGIVSAATRDSHGRNAYDMGSAALHDLLMARVDDAGKVIESPREALLEAIAADNAAGVVAALAAGAEPSEPDDSGDTPVVVAARVRCRDFGVGRKFDSCC